jgi:hypothetical protein
MTRDRDGFDDGRDEGAGWREPAHLGEGGTQPPAEPDRSQPAGWEPPGWSLPSADPRGEAPEEQAGRPPIPPSGGGLFGSGRRRGSAEEQVVERDPEDWAVREWAARHGWTVGDGTAPEDAVLRELVATAPVRRITKDSRPARVLRGRAGSIELVAFDVVYEVGAGLVPQYAVTAAPVLLPLPRMRLSPVRFWKHGIGGLMQLPSGDAEFDSRWVLLTEQDSPELRRLVADPTLRGLLLGSDDGDEFWTAAGHVAAIRPDRHRALLVEHHARLLGAVLGALSRV